MRLVAVFVGLLGCSTMAYADGPTHEFRVTSAKTLQADCGSDGCVAACMMHASLRSLAGSKAPDLTVSFEVDNDVVKLDDRRVVQFSFESAPLSKSVSDILSIPCNKLTLISPKIVCIGDDGCRAFINVRILKHVGPFIAAAKVQMD